MSDARSSRVGSQFGQYQLTRLLGRGGMGEVYEAQDTASGHVVALKLLSPSLSHAPEFRERLQREARTVSQLRGPHMVAVHRCGEIDDQLYLEMDLIEGSDLANMLTELGPLPPARAVALVRQIALALDAAHAAGVTHRDVKPENILVTPDDFAYLVDFGIADAAALDGATPVGDPVGTLKYSAPELFGDGPSDRRVDVYSLACVLYECLTGWSPYRGDNARMLITAHLTRPIPRPSQLRIGTVPEAFDDVIARGMAKEPHARYPSAGALAQAAYRALSGANQPYAEDTEQYGHVEETHNLIPPSPPQPPVAPPPPAPEPTPRPAEPTVAAGTRTDQSPDTGWTPQAQPGHGQPPETAFPRPRPTRWQQTSPLVLAAAVAVVVIAVAVAIWLLRPSHSTPAASDTTSPAAPAPPTPDPAAQTRLTGLLPTGYPAGACKPATPAKDALATMACGKNTDPDGPPSATYALYPDGATLRSAFNTTVQDSTIVLCPGMIQSPGPWHRTATPDKPAGMLLCATQKTLPIVAWTNEATNVLTVVRTEPQGPTMEQLYLWWGSHS